MMKTFKKILTLTILLALPIAATAVYMFKTLDARDGLTSSQVNCILKADDGYMWFGTPAGLYRYDGYTFKAFQTDSQDGSSLPDSYITSIQEALDHTLWICTASGYCIYHPQSESFERDMRQTFAKMGIDRVPSIIYIDRHHNIWGAIPNKGVVCYNMQQQQHYEFGYTDDAHGVPQGNVCSISECRDGALIVYDDGRIVCCDVMHQQHTVWKTNEIADRKLRRSKSLKAFADQKDNIWLYGQGTLFVYNKTANTWNTAIGDQLGLTGIGVDNAVNGMGGDKSGNIWIGTDRAGLVKMNVNDYSQLEYVQPKNINIGQFRNDVIRVQSIYVDNTDLVWVGTEKSGVAYSGGHIYRFESLLNGDITAMAQDANGKVWYGTSDNGVIGFDGYLSSQKVSALEFTKDGSMWVGTKQNGLTRVKDGVSTVYSVAKDSMATLIDDHVNALCTDKVGNLWIATNGGLQVFNTRMNSFSSYTRENRKINTNNITSLYFTKNNTLLIGTGEGLTLLNLSNTETQHLTGNSTNLKTFTNNYITQVFQDSRGLIWIGTREGVNILNLENDNLDYLTEKQGLCNNNICGITEDKRNNIWLTTSNGVSRVVIQRDHEEGSFTYGLYNYNVADGLQSNEFNPGSVLTKQDGDVLISGLYGVNWTRQDKGDTEGQIKVMLTQLYIGEEEVLIGHQYDGNVILTQALNATSHIDLNNDQSTFTVKFAAGNYNQSERLQFMYWLEGHDQDWKNGDALKHGVTFHDLGSGTYKLHVMAVSAEGAVSNQERILEIKINRHWLLSWWMIASYIAVIALVLYIWKIGIKQVREIKKKKEAVIEELKRQKDEILAASEDLRQPMARMTSIIGNLSENDRTLEEREQLNALHSQMLQVITRVSDMQTSLEHPEEKARQDVRTRYALNSKGEMNLPTLTSDDTMSERRARRTDAPTSHYVVLFIDDNEDFLKFVSSHLRDVYDLHVYNDTRKAEKDLDTMNADIVVCKQEMRGISGSDLCNDIKMSPVLNKIKFVLMTEGVLSPQDMKSMNITMSADDYLAKPFNIQDAIMRFNALLGLGPMPMNSNLIEGSETRMLESHNSSMTTATESLNLEEFKAKNHVSDATALTHDEMSLVETTVRSRNPLARQGGQLATQDEAGGDEAEREDLMSEFSMVDNIDRQLLKNIEQYVLQNMSRGQISLEEMANAMGMGRVPFFHKIRSITNKTPAELVRDLRLKHACVLLKRTNINMSELATNIGFVTAENFITTFKEKFGLSPLEYRLKHSK